MSYEAALKEYSRFEFDDGHYTRTVYRRGQGPGVIVMHEIPGCLLYTSPSPRD